jgi:hypothetical protein
LNDFNFIAAFRFKMISRRERWSHTKAELLIACFIFPLLEVFAP